MNGRNGYSQTPTPEPNGYANGNANGNGNGAGVKVQPLLCSGHTRPVVHLQFSNLLDDGTYLLISSCKDGNPMLRNWLGDWIGTFIGTYCLKHLSTRDLMRVRP